MPLFVPFCYYFSRISEFLMGEVDSSTLLSLPPGDQSQVRPGCSFPILSYLVLPMQFFFFIFLAFIILVQYLIFNLLPQNSPWRAYMVVFLEPRVHWPMQNMLMQVSKVLTWMNTVKLKVKLRITVPWYIDVVWSQGTLWVMMWTLSYRRVKEVYEQLFSMQKNLQNTWKIWPVILRREHYWVGWGTRDYFYNNVYFSLSHSRNIPSSYIFTSYIRFKSVTLLHS